MGQASRATDFCALPAADVGSAFPRWGAPDPTLRAALRHLDDGKAAPKAGDFPKAQSALGDVETTVLNSEAIKHSDDAAGSKQFSGPDVMAQVNSAHVELAHGDTLKARTDVQQAFDAMRATLVNAGQPT